MARIEDLLTEIDDLALRKALEKEVGQLKERKEFGLVFERHQPESVLLAESIGVRVGDQVQLRKQPKNKQRYKVTELDGQTAYLADEQGAAQQVPVEDLLVAKEFGDPIYPALTSLGEVGEGTSEPHLVLNGENFHALQILAYTHSGQADCIYIDPPYNTGAKDWKYNNAYVDDADRYRHSKWLSFMEKRLLLAKRLLKPDGVLIVTIDEHEVTHLGVLLEEAFPDALRQLVSIVINPKGVTQGRLSRVEEYAYFCFFGDAVVSGLGDDLLTPLTEESAEDDGRPRWKGLLRSGTNARREDRKRMFYPVLIDEERKAVVGVGEPLLPEEQKDGSLTWPEPDLAAKINGFSAAWPIRKDGSWGNWGVGCASLSALIEQGYVALGGYDIKRKTWGISYLSRLHQDQIAAGVLQITEFDEVRNVVDVRYLDPQKRRIKTVWHRSAHDAGAYGSDILRAFLPGERLFPFPKSLYAVRDSLAVATGARPDALIIDFFAGSGTTLHATCLLNAHDNGNRRCILVTNNEVDAETTAKLHAQGVFAGDEGFESKGIFELVTRPRVEAAILGKSPSGEPVGGKYLDGRPFEQGFVERAAFFRIDYLDPDRVELGLEHDTLHPLLWLLAGAYGKCPEGFEAGKDYAVMREGRYAVLSDTLAFPDLLAALADEDGVRRVFLITDDQDAFAEMTTKLGPTYKTHMFPRDYLAKFRINTGAIR